MQHTHIQHTHGAQTHPLLLVAVELDNLDAGAEAPELVAPVVHGGLGHHHHVVALDATVLAQICDKRDCLERLTQALQ